jgi:hypothetical protein
MPRLANCLLCLSACGLLACALPAGAATWKPLAKDSKAVMSADMASIVQDGTLLKVWVRYDYFTPLRERNGTDTINITARYVMDCSTQTVGTEQEIHHALHTVNGESAPLPMAKAAPGSFNEMLLKAVCPSSQ